MLCEAAEWKNSLSSQETGSSGLFIELRFQVVAQPGFLFPARVLELGFW